MDRSQNVSFDIVNQHVYTDALQTCVIANVMDTNVATELQEFIDQRATAKETNPLSQLLKALANPYLLLAIVVGILIFVLAPLLGGAKMVTKVFTSKYFVVSAVVLVIFLVVFFWVIVPRSKQVKENNSN